MNADSIKSLKKIIAYLFYLFVFLLPWQTKLILRPSESSFSEISLYASHLLLFLILVLYIIARLKSREFDGQISNLWYLLAGVELFVFISFFCAPDKVLAFSHYVIFLAGLGVFYLLREGMRSFGYIDSILEEVKIIYIFLASLLFQVGLGVYQFLTQTSPVSKYLGLAAHDPNILGVSVIETASGRWLRAYGGLDHPNIFGGVLAIALILAAYLLAKKKIVDSTKEYLESAFLFIFYFCALFALFFTFSRSAWLAFAVGMLFLLIELIRSKDRWFLGRFLALIFFSLILLSIIIPPYKDLLSVRVKADSRLEQKSLTERQTYIQEAGGLIKSHWLLGVGVGNYTEALKVKDNNSKGIFAYQPVHNFFLLLLAENGIFTFVFFLIFLFMLIKKGQRKLFSTAIFFALLIIMLFDHWLLSLPFGILFLFLALGLI